MHRKCAAANLDIGIARPAAAVVGKGIFENHIALLIIAARRATAVIDARIEISAVDTNAIESPDLRLS
jgi:hypothetical protein